MAQEQLKKQVDELAKDCARKEKELVHEKELARLQYGDAISQKTDISPLTGTADFFQVIQSLNQI